MLFFVCYVGYEYAMRNFTPNKLHDVYVMFTGITQYTYSTLGETSVVVF